MITIRPRRSSVTLAVEPMRSLELRTGSLRSVQLSTGGRGPQGPSGAAVSSYVHTQASSSAAWTISHNLGFEPVVEVRTLGGVVVEAEVLHVSTNVAMVNLAAPLAGTARCL